MPYRADLPLMVLAYRDNHHAAVTVPAGALIEVKGLAEDDRFVVVNVNGEEFLVFATDIESRSSRVENTRPAREKADRSEGMAVGA